MASRQTQTASAIKSQIETPGWQFDSEANWRGDQQLRVVQEIPLYNALVHGVYGCLHPLLGPQNSGAENPAHLSFQEVRLLDLCGKLVSIGLWIAAFLLLQKVWKRLLTASGAFWANVLFVLSPLSAFYTQAVMPESLLMLLSVGFIWATLRYAEDGKRSSFALLFLFAVMGLLLKAPAFSHLGLFAGVLLGMRLGWKRVFTNPIHWLAMVAILVAVKGWAGYVDHTNAAFGDWTASGSLADFLGKISDRFNPRFFVKVTGYVSGLLLTPVGLLGALYGLWVAWRGRRAEPRFVHGWILVASLAGFYLLWGPRTAGAHSYYNLVSLIPLCWLFGLGASRFVEGRNGLPAGAHPVVLRPAAVVLLGALLAGYGVGAWYLFRRDTDHWNAIVAVRDRIPPGSQVMICNLTSPEAVDYPHLSDLPYYTGLTSWIWTPYLKPQERARALERASWLVIFRSPESSGKVEKLRQLYKGIAPVSVAIRGQEQLFSLYPVEEYVAPGVILRRKALPPP